MENKITFRSILIGIILVIICSLWIRQVELIYLTCQISESIPPATALAVLLFLTLTKPILNLFSRRWQLSRQEIITVYVFVMLGSVMSGVGIMQTFLPYLTVPYYFATPENNYSHLTQYIPRWLIPAGEETIRTFFEGADTGKVPWAKWIIPGLIWLAFFLTFWWTAFCMWCIFRRQWSEHERLSFPLVNIPLSITDTQFNSKVTGGKPFFRNPFTWLGFAIVGIYQIFNILNAVNPGVPALGVMYPLGNLFTEPPLNTMPWTELWYRPELVGLGYLISTEVLFSVWFFYWLENLTAVVVGMTGVRIAGFPFVGEQGIGAYLGLAGITIFVARHHLISILKSVFSRGPKIDDHDEPITYRWAVLGFIAGLVGLIGFLSVAGVAVWVSILFFLLIFTFLLVYGKVRAETGVPSLWMLPPFQLKQFPFYFFGSEIFKLGGTMQTLSVWTTFFFLIQASFINQSTVYQLESFKLAEETNLSRKRIAQVGFFAVLVGLVVAFLMFLSTSYDVGMNILGEGKSSGSGGSRVTFSQWAWNDTAGMVKNVRHPNSGQSIATISGTGIVSGLFLWRRFALKVPFNPVGFLIATNIGTQVWWPFFLAWLVKIVVLKFGGVKWYQKTIPFFLALAIGQYFFGGIVWGLLAQWFPDAKYMLWFT